MSMMFVSDLSAAAYAISGKVAAGSDLSAFNKKSDHKLAAGTLINWREVCYPTVCNYGWIFSMAAVTKMRDRLRFAGEK
ncbi:MAG TPA: hypothetical protein GXZ59_05055 [Clostridiaceae bacterium]|nr:hypothetical protein [Clostridiaceae bacterium]